MSMAQTQRIAQKQELVQAIELRASLVMEVTLRQCQQIDCKQCGETTDISRFQDSVNGNQYVVHFIPLCWNCGAELWNAVKSHKTLDAQEEVNHD